MTKYWKQQDAMQNDANTNNSNLYLYYPTLYKGFIEAKLPTKNNFKKKMLLSGGSENGTIILYQPIPSALL